MRERLALAGIVCIGAVTRLYRLDLTWFTLDQARDVSAASGIAALQHLPLLGPRISLTDAWLGPFYYYLLAVPFLLTREPLAGAYFVALSSVGAIPVFYYFAKAFFGQFVAVRAAALFAVFPLSVMSSRGIWNIGFLPVFVVLFMWALYSVIAKGQSRSIIWALGLWAVLVQLHLSTVSLAAVALVAFVLFRPPVRLAHALLGLGLFLLVLSPYLYYEAGHRFENTRAMAQFAAFDQGLGGQRALAGVLVNALSLYPSGLYALMAEYEWPRPFVEGLFALYGVEALLFAGGVALCLYRLLSAWTRPQAGQALGTRSVALLLLWLAVPILALGSKKTAVFYWYLDILYPSQFVFMAMSLAALAGPSRLPSWVRTGQALACSGLLVAIVVSQAYFQTALQQRIDRRGELVVNGTVDISRPWFRGDAPPSIAVTLLPFGHRSGMLRALLADFPGDRAALFRTLHGAVLGAPEGNAKLLPFLSSGVAAASGDAAAPGVHHLAARDGADWVPLHVLRSQQIGSHRIVEYRPIIDYGSWSYVVAPNRSLESVRALHWKKVDVPALALSVHLGRDEVFLARGGLRAPSTGAGVKMAVAIMGEAPLTVIGLEVNGKRLAPVAQRVRYDVFSWVAEARFDLTGFLGLTENALVVEIAGPGHVIAFDVYEGSSL